MKSKYLPHAPHTIVMTKKDSLHFESNEELDLVDLFLNVRIVGTRFVSLSRFVSLPTTDLLSRAFRRKE